MLMTNRFDGMYDGQCRYSPMCNENGGIVDDLIVCKRAENRYFVVVNAGTKDKDVSWIRERVFGDCVMEDISDSLAQVALQGPKAPEILRKVAEESSIPVKYYSAVFDAKVGGMDAIVSRTGYTGENGYEIFVAADQGPRLWELLLEAGKDEGLIPCGLGARDTLRMEAAMPLYGHEMNDEITPLEAGLNFAVKMDKEAFIGKEALEAIGEPKRRRIGLKTTGRGIIREHQDVYYNGEKVGHTTSGTFCPFVGCSISMALIDASVPAEPGTVFEAEVRGKRVTAEAVPLPFYRKGQEQGTLNTVVK